MKLRTKLKMREQKIEGLRRGNRYLMDLMERQAEEADRSIERWVWNTQILELLLYASVIAQGGSVTIKTEGLEKFINGYEIERQRDDEAKTVTITAKKKEQA